MEFFKKFFNTVTDVKDTVVEKNRKAALVNRLRTVIRCEEQVCSRTYAALGRYYYQNLRDAENEDTEAYCREIDTAKQRLASAVEHLDEIYKEADAQEMGTAEESEEDAAENSAEAYAEDSSRKAAESAEEEHGPSQCSCEAVNEEAADQENKPGAESHETAVDGENDDLTFE